LKIEPELFQSKLVAFPPMTSLAIIAFESVAKLLLIAFSRSEAPPVFYLMQRKTDIY